MSDATALTAGPSPEARYAGGIACRDGHAARFEAETGRNWYAAITQGRPRRPRYQQTGARVARPASAPLLGNLENEGVPPR